MKSKTSAALLLILTFLLGGVMGGVSYFLYQHNVATPNSRSRRDPVNDLAKALNLDASQKEMLHKIMDKSRERYRTLDQQIRRQYETSRQQMRPQYDAIRTESRQEIRQILREDQKARFEEYLKEMARQRKEREPKSSQ
jgi:uncharacterized membrane protein